MYPILACRIFFFPKGRRGSDCCWVWERHASKMGAGAKEVVERKRCSGYLSN
jgi:hypothetical protein